MNDRPKIGIIFLTYRTKNWEEDINRGLSSIAALDYPKDRLELICVESQGDREAVKPWFDAHWSPKSGQDLPRISYILDPRQLGFAPNNNIGYAKAKELGCEYVFLMNEDAEAEPDSLSRSVDRAQSDPKIAIVQSLILLGQDRNRVNSMGNSLHFLGFGYSRGYLWDKQKALTTLESEKAKNPDLTIGYASGAAMLARVSAMDECGGLFDDGFISYHEDTDASLRPMIRGWKIVIEPKSIVHHYYEFAKSKTSYYLMERNRYALLFSYYRIWTLFVLLPIILIMDLAILVFSVKNGWADMKLKAYRDLFDPAFRSWLMARRGLIQQGRTVSDRRLLKRAVATIEFQADAVKNPVLAYVGNPILKIYWSVAKYLIA